MHRLFPVLLREITDIAWECVKWTLAGAVFFVGMWFLTDGLPRLVAIINRQMPAPLIHSTTSQLAPLHHLTSPRGDL